jgi:hypothetical protein
MSSFEEHTPQRYLGMLVIMVFGDKEHSCSLLEHGFLVKVATGIQWI